ncbi:pyridoxamine 5-phosphate oxidase [Pelagovum pacificum]|uniref:HugZ family pyridoxamine 5'-phosphate oxidase n=1 Tax=Pelagovum pacificum TaxID=2588711 RepID=UPI002F42EEED
MNETNEEARELARRLLQGAGHAALAVNDPDGPAPLASRVAIMADERDALILVSDLSTHTRGLRSDGNCSLLIGEPGPKGDPLTHPRMTFIAEAFATDKLAHRERWLQRHPPAKLWFDFADFTMFRLTPRRILLNGGFGKAYHLMPEDLDPQ